MDRSDFVFELQDSTFTVSDLLRQLICMPNQIGAIRQATRFVVSTSVPTPHLVGKVGSPWLRGEAWISPSALIGSLAGWMRFPAPDFHAQTSAGPLALSEGI
jgi:hypothetical protein